MRFNFFFFLRREGLGRARACARPDLDAFFFPHSFLFPRPLTVSYNTGPGDGSPADAAAVQNPGFWLIMDYLVHGPACGGRLHWGKAGWPTLLPAWNPVDATTGYPATWCDFGCAVQALDPGGKFRTTSPVWRWGVQAVGGGPATLAACCGAAGFNSTACVCTPPGPM